MIILKTVSLQWMLDFGQDTLLLKTQIEISQENGLGYDQVNTVWILNIDKNKLNFLIIITFSVTLLIKFTLSFCQYLFPQTPCCHCLGFRNCLPAIQ